jgi:hypothetical protein
MTYMCHHGRGVEISPPFAKPILKARGVVKNVDEMQMAVGEGLPRTLVSYLKKILDNTQVLY